MNATSVIGVALVVLSTTATSATAQDYFQLLGEQAATPEVQTVGWPFHFGHHHHYHGRYRVYSPGYSSFGFRINVGPIGFGSYPIYPIYTYRSYAPCYSPYIYYPTPYYGGYTYSYFSAADPAPAQPQTKVYVIAPPAKQDDAAATVAQAPPSMKTPTDDLQRVVGNLRVSNATSRSRARDLVAQGDRLFADQQFSLALARYKSAVAAAPDFADGYFREGHAFVATNQFDLAAKAFKLAVLLSNNPKADGISLEAIYAGNRLAKNARIEAVAQAALANRSDSDLLFVVGMLLHYDSQADRATMFFQKAAELAGGQPSHLRPFLSPSAGTPPTVVAALGKKA